LQIRLADYLGFELSEGLALSAGLVLESTGFEESEGRVVESDGGGEAMLPEAGSVFLVSFDSVVLDAVPSAFLCLVVFVVDEESPCMLEEAGLVASCAFESWAFAPKAVKPRASAAIAMYFMHISLWIVGSTEAGVHHDAMQQRGADLPGRPARIAC
jgi:hypothetical protein